MSVILRSPPEMEVNRSGSAIANTSPNPIAAQDSESQLYSALLQKFACSLCHEVYINTYVTNCHHKFCRRCILKWLRYCRKCPECVNLVRKITPLKRLDSEIERAFTMLPADERRHREDLKMKRFKAELEWKRLKMAQDTFSSLHSDKMKAAAGLRQKIKDSKKTLVSKKFRPDSDGPKATTGFPRIPSKAPNTAVKKKKLTEGINNKQLEFIKFPPLKYENQESTKLSLASLETAGSFHSTVDDDGGGGSKGIGKYSLSDRELYTAYTRFRTMMKLTKESREAASAHSNPALPADDTSSNSDGRREVHDITSIGAIKEREQEEIKKRLRAVDIDEVEEFLKNFPVESIWEKDLSVVLQVHGDAAKNVPPNAEDSDSIAPPKSPKPSEKSSASPSIPKKHSEEYKLRTKLIQQLTSSKNHPASASGGGQYFRPTLSSRQKTSNIVDDGNNAKQNDFTRPKPTGLRRSYNGSKKNKKKTKRQSATKIHVPDDHEKEDDFSIITDEREHKEPEKSTRELLKGTKGEITVDTKRVDNEELGRPTRKASKLKLDRSPKPKYQSTDYERLLHQRKTVSAGKTGLESNDSLEELLSRFRKYQRHGKIKGQSFEKHQSPKASNVKTVIDSGQLDTNRTIKGPRTSKAKSTRVDKASELNNSSSQFEMTKEGTVGDSVLRKSGKTKGREMGIPKEAFVVGESAAGKAGRKLETAYDYPPQTAPDWKIRSLSFVKTRRKARTGTDSIVVDTKRDPSTFRRSLFPAQTEAGNSILSGILNRAPTPTTTPVSQPFTRQTTAASVVEAVNKQPRPPPGSGKTKTELSRPKGYDSMLQLYLRPDDSTMKPLPSPVQFGKVGLKEGTEGSQESSKHHFNADDRHRKGRGKKGKKRSKVQIGIADRSYDTSQPKGRRSRVRTTSTPTVEMKLFGHNTPSPLLHDLKLHAGGEKIAKIPQYPVGLVETRDSTPSPRWSNFGIQRHHQRFGRANPDAIGMPGVINSDLDFKT